ncbi:hypothetical protein NLO413_0912 [Candidatus Neoehrlichia lotoris str. RAC413]|uniref:Uncharacterized protein n=1 Tax=Candidatus Neoehrlichia procyonis str. RAC413 TaxID=1359163 RepID=A0A0F3NRI5_9RICK|nr:hypothetical protein NLO413_0912 [Candidatus Neoehrlichia lotoris str. RAC413]
MLAKFKHKTVIKASSLSKEHNHILHFNIDNHIIYGSITYPI